MRSNEYLWNVCMEMYREMYKNAQPSADFDELIRTGEAKKEGFFKNYYIPDEQYHEIYNRIKKKYKLTKREDSKVAFTVHLGCGPTCKKPDDWDQEENDG